MVTLSSFYVYIFRIFLIIAILINSIGVLIIKFFLPEDKAATYDLTPFIMLIIVCGIILMIFLNLHNVSFDKKNKTLNINNLKNKFIVSNNNVIKVERIFIFFCKITYKEETSQKSIIFLPSLRTFFPLLDYPQKIRDLIRN